MSTMKFITAAVVLLGLGCGPEPIKDKITYEDLILEGWLGYSMADYDDAVVWFEKAFKKDTTRAEALTGLAWASMKLGLLDDADILFNRGVGRTGLKADHYAGWAFLAHDRLDYEASNTYADNALIISPTWSFPYASGIGASDLVLMKAMNFYLMGDYAASLATVKTFNATFNADVSTGEGRQALAQEIERLRSLTKRTP